MGKQHSNYHFRFETCVVNSYDNGMHVEFQSAWSPPVAWLETTSELYPDLSFRLTWVDEDFPSSGEIEAKGGITKNINYGYRSQAREFVKVQFPDIYEYQEEDRKYEFLVDEMN